MTPKEIERLKKGNVILQEIEAVEKVVEAINKKQSICIDHNDVSLDGCSLEWRWGIKSEMQDVLRNAIINVFEVYKQELNNKLDEL